ncbi:hypothetical protein B9479_004766 [Cryptococcus floricola]|uniref:RRM domain-containing protein n=1 Tax=Cryptococcus floricola TaxID=2591691 RepID=A0A5D3AWA6_9TREE|nr:hypothetical protein B9479_004766 [Cryptococcus floricola]
MAFTANVRSPSPSDSLVEHDTYTPPKPSNAPDANPTNILGVFGLSVRTTEKDLREEFSEYGQVEKVVIVYDQRTGRSRGFGFITMRSVDEASICITKLNGNNIHGRHIRVDFSATRKPHHPTPGQYLGPQRAIPDDIPLGRPRYEEYRGHGGERFSPYWDLPEHRGRPRHDERGRYKERYPARDYDRYISRPRRDDYDYDLYRTRSRSPRPARYSVSPERRVERCALDYDEPRGSRL